MKSHKFLIPLAFAALLGACSSTPNSRTAGQFVDDASITTRVKTQLAQTESVGQALTINVDTYRGVVSLNGFVDNQQQARDAAVAASKVAGVDKVINNLQVKPQASGK